MIKVIIKGVEYPLRFDLNALEMIEEKYGSLNEMWTELTSGKHNSKMLRGLFAILANNYLEYIGKSAVVSEELAKHASLGIMAQIKEALNEGMKAETLNGNEADDSIHDGYLDEIEQEEKKD